MKTNPEKYCKFCFEFFPHDDPHWVHQVDKRRSRVDLTCRKRNREFQKKWRERNKEKVAEQIRRWRETPRGKYGNLKKRAHQKGLPCDLTYKEYFQIQKNPCEYCDEEPDSRLGYGVDRKDNKLGYSKDNCCACCGACNQMKGHRLTYEEMKVAMKAILALREVKKP